MGSGALACPLCREPLGDQEARCARCGVATPDVGGVRILLADPFAALQATRDEVLASFARSAAASATSGSDTQANAAIAANQSLYEHVTKPALAVARHGAGPSTLASTFATSSEAWALTSLLKYFYADWGGPRDEVRTLLCDDARQYAGAGGFALVLGCGAGGLVHDLATEYGVTCGVDASVPALLLAKELCEGGSFECHLEKAGWKRVTLHGHAAPPDRTQWVAANALRLPFLEGSLERGRTSIHRPSTRGRTTGCTGRCTPLHERWRASWRGPRSWRFAVTSRARKMGSWR